LGGGRPPRGRYGTISCRPLAGTNGFARVQKKPRPIRRALASLSRRGARVSILISSVGDRNMSEKTKHIFAPMAIASSHPERKDAPKAKCGRCHQPLSLAGRFPSRSRASRPRSSKMTSLLWLMSGRRWHRSTIARPENPGRKCLSKNWHRSGAGAARPL
jgi:hypothetical protein